MPKFSKMVRVHIVNIYLTDLINLFTTANIWLVYTAVPNVFWAAKSYYNNICRL